MNLFNKLKRAFVFCKYANRSFSQEGEDQLLDRILEEKPRGFYIDIGAHHPIRFSNTYKFYLRGWSGINIDAMPGSMAAFNNIRPRDINIEVPVSDKKQKLTYYIFNEPALNTFSLKEATSKDGLYGYKIVEKVELETDTLASILKNNIINNQEIDFMSIDVEGLDIQVLYSNDWNLYKPKLILIEELLSGFDLTQHNSNVNQFLIEKGYVLFARTVNTSFYKLNF